MYPLHIDVERFLLSDSVTPIVGMLTISFSVALACYVGFRSDRIRGRTARIWLGVGLLYWALTTVYWALFLHNEMLRAPAAFLGAQRDRSSYSAAADLFSLAGSGLFWFACAWFVCGVGLAVWWYVRLVRFNLRRGSETG